jgi:hypothetical protein
MVTSHEGVLYYTSPHWFLAAHAAGTQWRKTIHTLQRGAFSIARFDLQGYARAQMRGTSERLAPRFFIYVSREIGNSRTRSLRYV